VNGRENFNDLIKNSFKCKEVRESKCVNAVLNSIKIRNENFLLKKRGRDLNKARTYINLVHFL
jgi:hypothetical protein